MSTATIEDSVLLAMRLGLPIRDSDQAAFRDAFAGLLDQARLVLAMQLPDDDFVPAPFRP